MNSNFDRLLYWKVGRLSAFEDLIDICRGSPKQVGKANTIGHQATVVDKLTI